MHMEGKMKRQLLKAITLLSVLVLIQAISHRVIAANGEKIPAGSSIAEQADLLMNLNGSRAQLILMAPQLEKQAEMVRKNEDLPERNREIAARVMLRMFEPTALIQYVHENLTASWDAPTMNAAMDFLRSPLGMKMTELEVNDTGPEAEKGQEEWMANLDQNPPSEERIILTFALDEAAHVSAFSIEIWTILSMTTALAVHSSGSLKVGLSQGWINEVKSTIRKQLAEPMQKAVILSMLYKYRNATDDELRAYVDFYKLEAGQQYVKAMMGAELGAFNQAALSAGQEIRAQVAL